MSHRLGILGGTFDPIHLGHLILAEQARVQLSLDRVLFMPAAVPPHKMDLEITDCKWRREMIDIAIGGHAGFQVSTIEMDRAGVSYTIDTLETLAEQYPASERWLIVGADTIADVPNWRRPEDVVASAGFAVAGRPGFDMSPPTTLPQLRMQTVEMPLLEISSRFIRQQVYRQGSIRYLVPAGVEAYIHAKGLYRPAREDATVAPSP
jgi:nicotinate-nucleotide adenylyltransferase